MKESWEEFLGESQHVHCKFALLNMLEESLKKSREGSQKEKPLEKNIVGKLGEILETME